jgi:hypothetical protein
VGSKLGSSLGEKVGAVVGASVVGDSEGKKVGAPVRFSVSTSVADTDGDSKVVGWGVCRGWLPGESDPGFAAEDIGEGAKVDIPVSW